MTTHAPITVYTATCFSSATSCLYPNKIEITDEVSAKRSFSKSLILYPVQKQLPEYHQF